MNSRQLMRWAAIAGLVFAVLTLVGVFAAGSPPSPKATPDVVRRFFVDKESMLRVGALIQALGGVDISSIAISVPFRAGSCSRAG